MKNLLTKTLFILFLLSVVVSPVMQANDGNLSTTDFSSLCLMFKSNARY